MIFQPSIGVSDYYSTRTIMTGTSLDFSKHCALLFGACAEPHEEYHQTNTITEQARGVICLGPTRNFQGRCKMLCISKRRKVTRKQFEKLSMPDAVIKRIEAITVKEKQDETSVFTNRNNATIDDGGDADSDVTAGVDDYDESDDGVDSNNPTGTMLDEASSKRNHRSA
jgi:hypothetical protein